MDADPLTWLPTREFLRKVLADTFTSAREAGRPLSVIAVDLDLFAEFNRRFGIFAADHALVAVARCIRSIARPCDLVVRDGGDQFTLLLAGTNGEDACREAERIRCAIASTTWSVYSPDTAGSSEWRLTVTMGVASLEPADADSWHLFERARMAVHKGKARGRNCVAMDTTIVAPLRLDDSAHEADDEDDGGATQILSLADWAPGATLPPAEQAGRKERPAAANRPRPSDSYQAYLDLPYHLD